MSVINSIPLIAAGDDGYQISRSVRLRSSASAYFNRTLTTPTNNKLFTWSGWVKRSNIGVWNDLFGAGAAGANGFGFNTAWNDNGLAFFTNNISGDYFWLVTTQVFRDPSAWYHIVLSVDTTQATASNRAKIYLNGNQITAFNTAVYQSQNSSLTYNSATAHYLGALGGPTRYLDGYMTEVNFIDGQALTPSSFGETDLITGVWKPKAYAGTYGTNGFELNFSDPSAATAAAIGKDYSGNGNNWTPTNISVTAGVTYDSMLDVPTNYADGGNGRGNYCTLNPLDKDTNLTFSNGNLTATGTNVGGAASFGLTSSKWYWEVTLVDDYTGNFGFHGVSSGKPNSYVSGFTGYPTGAGVYAQTSSGGGTWANGSAVTVSTTWVANDVIGFAFDATNLTLDVYRNNTKIGTTLTVPSGAIYPSVYQNGSGGNTSQTAYNFGQRPFAYTPPTGFVALNTQNLPAPTISNGANYMAATTYTGTGSALTIANTVGSASFQPDLVWVKGRSGATDHAWYDAVRGVQNQLESNTTTAETTETTGLTAFGSTGFTVGALAQMNTNTATYVAWQWNAGGSTVTNTSGSISAQVRANPTAGFSVVTYTGTGANATVGHGLGVAPSMVIVKNRTASSTGWPVYHKNANASPASGGLRLNLTDAFVTYSPYWNNTVPTSTVFSLGSDNQVNGSTNAMVAYCFSAVAGYSAFGSYTGNGSVDGPFVYLGFRPRWLMIKSASAVVEWITYDTARSTSNAQILRLYPNSSGSETSASGYAIDTLSNGFKIRTDPNTAYGTSASGETYIYAAFAENPFKLSLAR